MRRWTWGVKRGWCLGLLLLAGCWTTNWTAKKEQRPPKHPEEFVVPPETASRFSAPPDFPQEMQKDRFAKMQRPDVPAPGMGMGPGSSRLGPMGGVR
jgi:hypothetical protein